ncbi:MAG TPA: metallophosphoesterase [Candidatus Binatia bacterium]|nr:metallophosphoesterase [Candidatus Binatia bacterium]
MSRLKESILLLLSAALLVLGLVEISYSQEACPSISSPVKHPAATTRFVAFGDGGSGSPEQFQLGRQMEEVRKITGFDTVLMLGDNLYPRGDTREAKSRFEQPYAELLKAGVRFYPILGNHDLHANDGRDQIAYFNMPGRWYSVQKGPLEFFMLDSSRPRVTEQQMTWLYTALASSTAPWKIVATHLPIYSSAHDGWTGLNWWLNIFLEPLLVKYRVSVVLSGHDHFYERIKPQRGIYYFISGGGGADIRAVKPKAFNERVASTHHFLLFEWAEDKGWFQAVDICGRVFDSGTLEPHGES